MQFMHERISSRKYTMKHSNIEWTDHTRNFWTGCTKVSPACANCYAEAQAKRNTKTFGKWGKGAPRAWHGENARKDLVKWDSEARSEGIRRKVFANSMSDWLDDEVPIGWLVFMLDTIRITPHLDYLLLSKRPDNFFTRHQEALMQCAADQPHLANWLAAWWCPSGCEEGQPHKPPHNVWIGTTVEDQKRAKERIPILLDIPARIRFLSCEPLLEPLSLEAMSLDPHNELFRYWPMTGAHVAEGYNVPRIYDGAQRIHWVIVGGESGPGFRPFNPDWARSLVGQCARGDTPFFMKQMGGLRKPFEPIPADLNIREFPSRPKR